MNINNFDNNDRKIIGYAAAVLFFSCLLLWQDGWIYSLVESKLEPGNSIGQVILTKNDTRRRHSTTFSWTPLSQTNKVFQGDSIFTGANSKIVIKTAGGEEIEVAENSMVVINEGQDSISIDIGFGSIQSKVQSKKLLITSNNNITEVTANRSSVIRVDAGSGRSLVFNVLKGEASVKSDNDSKVLKVSDLQEVRPGQKINEADSTTIDLKYPETNQYLKIGDGQPLVLKWNPSRKVKRTKIKIATDSDFKNTLVDSFVDDTQYAAYSLPKDTLLYWQVMAEGGLSRTQSFAVVGNRPPVLALPRTGQTIYFDPSIAETATGTKVDLSWELGSLATDFVVQLARSRNMAKDLVTAKSKKQTWTAPYLTEGKYFWRVRSGHFANDKWSDIAEFSVGREQPKNLPPPVPQSSDVHIIQAKNNLPLSNSLKQMSTRQLEKWISNPLRLRWGKVIGASQYEVQISTNSNFRYLVHRQTVNDNSLTWQSVVPGNFFWRVRAINASGDYGLFANYKVVVVKTETPIAMSDALIIDEVTELELMNSRPPPVKLSWKPVLFAKNYELRLSDTNDFSKARVVVTDDFNHTVNLDKAQVLYWKIQALDNNRTPISNPSDTFRFEFQRIYKDPATSSLLTALFPRHQDSVALVAKNRHEIDFKWNKIPDAKKYNVELSHSIKFSEVIHKEITNNNYFTYTKKFDSSTVYWRIRSESKDGVSDWTQPFRFDISYETKPFDFETSERIFIARLKAQERQKELLLAYQRKINRMRSPASTVDVQLEAPQILNPVPAFEVESNIPSSITAEQLVSQRFRQFYTQLKNLHTFRWVKVPAAERYFIHISRDPEFKEVIVNAPCWDNYFEWDTLRPGRYYYRVQAFNDRYSPSDFSVIQKIDILVAPPIQTGSDQFVSISDEPQEMRAPPSPVQLSWRPVVFARQYEIEVAQSTDYTDSKIYRTSDFKIDMQLYTEGTYYWRIRPIGDRDIVIGQYSGSRSFEMIQTERQPAQLNKLTGLYPIDRALIFVGKGTMKIPFYWKSPNPNEPQILEISKSKDFKSLLTKESVRSSSIHIKKDLPEGNIFWRVRTGNLTSDVFEFLLRREENAQKKGPLLKADP